jgi:uncharacterized circularly permuted ATP-grasp superfamily protein
VRAGSIFDEMNGSGGQCRDAYRVLQDWLNSAPSQLLEHRRDEAELLFRKVGITFAVYGNAESCRPSSSYRTSTTGPR